MRPDPSRSVGRGRLDELAAIRAAGARLAESAPPLDPDLLALVVRIVGPVPRAAKPAIDAADVAVSDQNP